MHATKQVDCPAVGKCSCIRLDHEKELFSYDTPQKIVWGGESRKCCKHIWCLPHRLLLATEKKLSDRWQDVLSLPFKDFEDLYDWIGSEILFGIWKNPRVLHYDIALRVSYQRYVMGTDDIRPSNFVYLHAKPWKSAKILDAGLSVSDYRKPNNYPLLLFACPFQCDPVQCEHVLCIYHKEISRKYGK